jgi:hypothetical protein
MGAGSAKGGLGYGDKGFGCFGAVRPVSVAIKGCWGGAVSFGR